MNLVMTTTRGGGEAGLDKANFAKFSDLPMFSGVDDATISSLLKGADAELRQYRKRETVFPMQSAVRHVFVVVSGALKISEYGERGLAHILRVCRPGHIVGLAHVLGHLAVFPGSCTAIEESEVLVLKLKGFHEALVNLRYGPLGENLFRMMSDDLLASWRAQSILSCRTIGDRMMTYLRWMQAETGKKEIVLSINRQELADLLGVHRTALSRTLAQLVASGQLVCRKNVFGLQK